MTLPLAIQQSEPDTVFVTHAAPEDNQFALWLSYHFHTGLNRNGAPASAPPKWLAIAP